MRKPGIRVITLVLAILLILGMFSGVFAMLASADPVTPDPPEPIYKRITADTTVTPTLTVGKVKTNVTVTFNFFRDDGDDPEDTYNFEKLSIQSGSSFSWNAKTKLKITKNEGNADNYFHAVLENVTYTGGSSNSLELYVYNDDDDEFYHWFSIPISSKYFRESSSGTDDLPISDIIIQSVTVKNAAGQKLDTVDKDTPPFSVEVVFYDLGLIDESKERLKSAKIHAFITGSTGFNTLSGTGGTVEVLTSAMPYPRFRATFSGIQSTDSVSASSTVSKSNSLDFRIQYDLPDYEKGVSGKATAVLFQAESSDDSDLASSLKPNVIIQEYSYGDESIVAGSEFSLDMKFSNTSKTTDVENVVMTIEPANGFVIAAASNTVYFAGIAAGETVPYSLALRTLAAGNNTAANPEGTTDYSVNVKFSYQYLSNKKYEPGETSVKIAIPVIQLDRFGVNEITDYSQYLTLGEEGYISVPIINKGNSTIFNIAGAVEFVDESAYTAPVVNFGNLEAGKSGTVDLSITINVPGEFNGKAVISYEDENMNQKQHTVPFSIMVNEPYIPPEIPVENPGEVQPAGPGIFSVLFCVIGTLLIAAPIALYSIKRIKARGSEDIDESF